MPFLMAGFCKLPIALREVSMFFNWVSKPLNVCQSLILLSKPRTSFDNFLHSMSIVSMSRSFQRVSFHSSVNMETRSTWSHSCFSFLLILQFFSWSTFNLYWFRDQLVVLSNLDLLYFLLALEDEFRARLRDVEEDTLRLQVGQLVLQWWQLVVSFP